MMALRIEGGEWLAAISARPLIDPLHRLIALLHLNVQVHHVGRVGELRVARAMSGEDWSACGCGGDPGGGGAPGVAGGGARS